MDTQKPRVKKTKPHAPQAPHAPQTPGGPEIWDGNNAGWTLVSYSKKKKNKK